MGFMCSSVSKILLCSLKPLYKCNVDTTFRMNMFVISEQ